MLLEQPAPAQSPVLHPTALHSSPCRPSPAPPWLPHKAPAEQHSWSPRDLHQGFQFLAKELRARARAAKMHKMHELRHHCWGMGWVWSQKHSQERGGGGAGDAQRLTQLSHFCCLEAGQLVRGRLVPSGSSPPLGSHSGWDGCGTPMQNASLVWCCQQPGRRTSRAGSEGSCSAHGKEPSASPGWGRQLSW